MTPEAKTLGECPTCGIYRALTMHHVLGVPDLKNYKILLCELCHKTITQYKIEIDKALKYLGGR